MTDTLKSSSSVLRTRNEMAVGGPASRAAQVVHLKTLGGCPLSRLVSRLRFRHLSLLVALDEHRNLHRAAKTVHLSQPTASKAVHDLESLFRSPLFDRVPTGMQTTEVGGVVVAFARRTLGELKRVAAAADRRESPDALVIGVSANLPPDRVAEAMAEIKRWRPGLPVKVICDSNDRVVNHLIEGQIELAVGYASGRVRQAMVDYEVIGHEPLCIVARPQHPLAQAPRLDIHTLQQAAWIFHSRSSCARQVIDHLFLRAGVPSPANGVESDSVHMTLTMLLRSDLLALLPVNAASRHLQDGQLVRLPVTLDGHLLEFGILTRRDEPLSPAALQFCRALRHPS